MDYVKAEQNKKVQENNQTKTVQKTETKQKSADDKTLTTRGFQRLSHR